MKKLATGAIAVALIGTPAFAAGYGRAGHVLLLPKLPPAIYELDRHLVSGRPHWRRHAG